MTGALYQDHFQLLQEPFSIAPDPSFLFLSDGHNEALAHLMYGFSHGGFVLITGEVGTGKTTLLRNLLDRTPADLDVAFILNPRLTVKELLETICEELGVPFGERKPDSVKQYIDLLNRHLLRTHQQGRSTVVIIDEAQNLSPAVLEQIRLLTNLETNERKLLRIILLGQPELGDMLARTELRQLAQRITARYHLESLTRADVADYVAHRLAKAGGNPHLFHPGALKALYRASRGTPRLINVIADRAMLGAYVAGKLEITAPMVRAAAQEVFGRRKMPSARYWLTASAAVIAIGVAMAWAYFFLDLSPDNQAAQAAQSTNPQQRDEPAQDEPPDRAEPILEVVEEPVASEQPQAAATGDSESAPPAIAAPLASVSIERPPGSTYQIQREAFAAVYSLWGATYAQDSDAIPCDFAPTAGLQCLRRSGGWSELNGLNAPVVLELWDSQSSPYYAAITRRSGNFYELALGGERFTVSPRDLRDVWFGTYVLIWQTPPSYHGNLREGDNHSSVSWLRSTLLELVPGLAFTRSDNFFDAALRQAVVDFQMSEGLLADGIVGPLTWIRLIDRLGSSGPKLDS